MDWDRDGYIGSTDIVKSYKALGVSVTRKRADDMLWVLDEDGDGRLTLRDFLRLASAVRKDRRGTVSHKLLDLFEFLQYDTDMQGQITIDDCITLLSSRFQQRYTVTPGELRKFYCDIEGSSGKFVSFEDFLEQVQLRRMLMYSYA